MSACCCIFPKGEQNFLAAKRPCGQFADSFADSHEKGVTSFDVTPCNLWSQHADLNRGPTDYEAKVGMGGTGKRCHHVVDGVDNAQLKLDIVL